MLLIFELVTASTIQRIFDAQLKMRTGDWLAEVHILCFFDSKGVDPNQHIDNMLLADKETETPARDLAQYAIINELRPRRLRQEDASKSATSSDNLIRTVPAPYISFSSLSKKFEDSLVTTLL
ncbi:hypothetical protein BY996DRAFT_6426619 [Phakopsora pachyrhizi]|nr:hypothetical protein BY996DRAFT_6426619 [Phakopsora pachyrhizi]